MDKFNFYSVKILSSLFLLFGIFLFSTGGYSSYKLLNFVNEDKLIKERIQNDPKYQQINERLKSDEKNVVSDDEVAKGMAHMQSLGGYAAIGAIIGLIMIISAIGLFFFKKWGIFLSIFSIFLLWVFHWMRVGGIQDSLTSLIILSLFGIYLVYNKKFIADFHKSFYQNNTNI